MHFLDPNLPEARERATKRSQGKAAPVRAPADDARMNSERSTRGGGGEGQARLLIADDHDLVREGLRAVLSGEEDLEVVGEATDGQEALKMCRSLKPDLVLMDVRMPKSDGLEATRAIKEEMPWVSVVMVTMHENPDYLLEAIRAGAAGYILKDAQGQRLVGAVRRTLTGESPLDEELAMRLLRNLAREQERSSRPDAEPPAPALTAQELEVLRLLALGQTNREIAQSVLSSVSTVKAHVRSTISKLGVSDRTQAAVRAIQLGLATSGMES